MKDLGPAKYLLGIQITQDEHGISMCQSTYIRKLAEEQGLLNAKTVSVPISGGDIGSLGELSTEEDEPIDSKEYRHLIGQLLYVSVATRPDIAFAMGLLGRFASKPTKKHLKLAWKVVAYLNSTANYQLTYRQGSGLIKLTGYSDSDWASDKTDRRSVTGYMFSIGEAPISWRSKKQRTVALSSTEAEYMASTQATKEAVWLRHLLAELGYPQDGPTIIQEDNQGAIAITCNPCHHERTKHIDIQYHFVREKTEDGTVLLEYCPTEEQVADLLTKPLVRD